MNFMEIGRPTLPMMRAALFLTSGNVKEASQLLVEVGFVCTQHGLYRRLRTKNLLEYARELRSANRRVLSDDPDRCRWAWNTGCNNKKASTRVDFCTYHQEWHNEHITKTKADRMRREVCVTCEGPLAPTSIIHCTRHLELANASSRRRRSKKGGVHGR